MEPLCKNCQQLPLFILVTCSICERALCERKECWDTPVKGTHDICGSCLANNKAPSVDTRRPADDGLSEGEPFPGEEEANLKQLKSDAWSKMRGQLFMSNEAIHDLCKGISLSEFTTTPTFMNQEQLKELHSYLDQKIEAQK